MSGDEFHRVEVTFEAGECPEVEFICSAPKGASCQTIPACFYAGDCEEYHNPDCAEVDRALVDAGECLVKVWIDQDPTALGHETKLSLAVVTEWTGDEYNWRATSAEVVTPE